MIILDNGEKRIENKEIVPMIAKICCINIINVVLINIIFNIINYIWSLTNIE